MSLKIAVLSHNLRTHGGYTKYVISLINTFEALGHQVSGITTGRGESLTDQNIPWEYSPIQFAAHEETHLAEADLIICNILADGIPSGPMHRYANKMIVVVHDLMWLSQPNPTTMRALARGQMIDGDWMGNHWINPLTVLAANASRKAWLDFLHTVKAVVVPSNYVAEVVDKALSETAPANIVMLRHFVHAPRVNKTDGSAYRRRVVLPNPDFKSDPAKLNLLVAKLDSECPVTVYTEALDVRTHPFYHFDAVEVHQQVPFWQAGSIYQQAGVVFAPSLYPETFGFVVAEAAAWGNTVITTNVGALPELVPEAVAMGGQVILMEPDWGIQEAVNLITLYHEQHAGADAANYNPNKTLPEYCTELLTLFA